MRDRYTNSTWIDGVHDSTHDHDGYTVLATMEKVGRELANAVVAHRGSGAHMKDLPYS